MTWNKSHILVSMIKLQKTVIYIFIKVYQEYEWVCVCVWSTLSGLSYGFIDPLGSPVLLISRKSYVVLF